MEIGILTFHNAENYGAVLQAYALQCYLNKTFTNVSIIDYNNTEIKQAYGLFNNIDRNAHIGAQIAQFFKRSFYIPQLMKKKKNFKDFKARNLKCSRKAFAEFDVIIYGSDQIWNTMITNFDLNYFGKNFTGKKIGYAVSDGNELSISEEMYCYLKQFSKIGCREKVLLDKLKIFESKLDIVCDPVFLLSKSEWEQELTNINYRDYILLYRIADNANLDEEAEYLSKKIGKKVIEVTYVKSIKKYFLRDKKTLVGVTPFQFVGFIKNANFILTTSFHGTAFSIIFEKSFYVLNFSKRSERITYLLDKLGLSKRYVETVKGIDIDAYYLDYDETIKEKYVSYVSNSKKFLMESLGV